ncbi:3154_t:CDS:1, partial [Funneliformis geosporum]
YSKHRLRALRESTNTIIQDTDKRPTLSSIPKSLEWKYDSTTRNMTVCKLRGNESVDYTIPLESEPFNKIRIIDVRKK